MNSPALFGAYLSDLMVAAKISDKELALQLGYHLPHTIELWRKGLTKPAISQLLDLSAILVTDPIDLLMAWIIDQEPGLEELLWAEVLDARRSLIPHSSVVRKRASWPDRSINEEEDAQSKR